MESCILKALLWNKSEGHDKIWGWVETPSGNIFRFWGKRSVKDNGWVEGEKRPSLFFKQEKNINGLYKLYDHKLKKKYVGVDVNNVDEVVPGFTEYFEQALIGARLSDFK